jgi:hypothetical protein
MRPLLLLLLAACATTPSPPCAECMPCPPDSCWGRGAIYERNVCWAGAGDQLHPVPCAVKDGGH